MFSETILVHTMKDLLEFLFIYQEHSKKYLWDLFHLSKLNKLLTVEPCARELQYDISSRHSTRRRMPVSRISCF